MSRIRLLLASSLLIVLTGNVRADDFVRFTRTPDISPDGQRIVFSYLGDLWTIGVDGGLARHLSMHQKHDFMPVFSPDGRSIAFSSNRHGGYDIFVMPAEGGRPTRLTFDSADEFATGWSPDGKFVLFSSNRGLVFPSRTEMFKVPATGGRETQLTFEEGREGALSPDGKQLAIVRGPGIWYRKGYRGSSNDEIWLLDFVKNTHRQITSFAGQDHSPMWSPEGRYLYYVSEHHGTPANIVRVDTTLPSAPERLTFHRDDGVRRARLSGNGKWIVYECGSDLWILSLDGRVSRKLDITVRADDKTNPDEVSTLTSGATEYALSYDEKHLAVVVHGEIFIVGKMGGKAQRITDHPGFDHGPAWSRDGRTILFLSDRNGHEDIYAVTSDDADHPELARAHRFKVTQLTDTPEGEKGLMFSPDGRKVSFLRDGKLVTMFPDGSGAKVVVQDGVVIDYEWSPDSQWFCYARMDGSFASELFIVPATGATATDPPRNVTRFATYNAGVTWSRSGHALAFISKRRGNSYSAHVLRLQKPAAPGASTSSDIDWEDIHLRVKQPSNMTVSECAISNDGSKIAFRGGQDGDDLWVASADGSQVTRITKGSLKPRQIQWSKQLSSQIFFRDARGNLRTASASGSTTGDASAIIPFQARMTLRRQDTFAEMFEQSWRALHETFYDQGFHGANWHKVRDKYRPLVEHCEMKEDLYALISLMLGELNASHLGISGNSSNADQVTAHLGLVFDRDHAGPGLKIAEILKRGPADRRGLDLKPGDVILAIDDRKLDEQTPLAALLNDKVNETVTLELAPRSGKNPRRLEVRGVSRTAIAPLMYDRWVDGNAKRVAELSKGSLGYIHIPSMNEAGLDRFLRSLYSDNFDKDAIVLDVRFNGGGYTHEQVLNYLGAKEHTYFHHRQGVFGLVLNFNDRKWTKPMAVLINNRSFSDAEIFPHAFRTLGLGKLIGQPTGGLVIGTRNMELIDGSTFRTPSIGVYTVKGVNMEREGVYPDYPVEVHPDQLARGVDAQLAKAVEVLQQEVIAWKKTHPPLAISPLTAPPAPPPGAGAQPR